MDYVINITRAESMPLHTHDQYEIICYTGGSGVMRTREGQYAVAENTIVIEAQAGVNNVASVDDENFTYVIENADESITSLVEGDVFVYLYGKNEILIVKVASIQVNGNTVTIPKVDGYAIVELS